MQHAETDSQLVLQIFDQPEERHRIRAARHGNADTVTRRNHMVATNCLDDAVMEFGLHARSGANLWGPSMLTANSAPIASAPPIALSRRLKIKTPEAESSGRNDSIFVGGLECA